MDAKLPADLSAPILGQLLLMQSVVGSLPDEQSIFSFVCRGLSDVPGVADASYAAAGGETTEPTQVRFPLRTGQSQWGELLLRISDPAAFAPYEAYLRNFCFMLAVILEERYQRRLIEQHKAELEQRVRERTERLTEEIAERRRIEEDLQKSRALFRAVVDGTSDAVYIKDLHGRYLLFNTAAERFTGKRSAEVLGQDDRLLFPPDVAAMLMAGDLKVIEGGTVATYEEVVTNAAGEIAIFLATKGPIFDASGKPFGLFGIARDITERKQAEERLAASHRQVQDILESISDAFFSLDDNLVVTYFNAAAQRILHRPAGEVLGRPLFDAFPEARGSLFERKYRQAIRDKQTISFEVDFRVSPYTNWYNVRVYPQAQGISVYFQVVTESKRVEAALQESEARHRMLFEASHDALMTLGPPSWQFTSCNWATVEMFRARDEAELTSLGPWALSTEKQPDGRESAEKAMSMIETAMREGSHFFEWTHRRMDGETFPAEVLLTRMERAGQAFLQATVRDISERKRAELERQQLQAQFIQAQKMEAVGQLAGGVAHDFNNILAAMLMQLNVLQETTNLEQESREMLRELEAEANRAAHLTRQLLMFSRRSVLEMRALDFNEVVANLLKMLGRLLGENIALVFERRNTLPSVEADAGMLEQALMNLAVNARDAMSAGGRITLATEALEIDAEQAAANPDRRAGRFVCLSVSDTGCGMDAATLKRIFEPFFTTKAVGKGTGLGLATVYGIVAQHRGWVEVESQVGQGTIFRIYLPASAKAATEVAGSGPQGVPKGQETLLVVEDDASVRKMLVQTLRVLGYRVFEAANGQEAVNMWRDHGRQIDLLLTDMVMPEGMTGLELAERIRAEKPDLKVIISSGYSAEMSEHGKMTATGIFYLSKPYQVSLLGRTVRECLDR